MTHPLQPENPPTDDSGAALSGRTGSIPVSSADFLDVANAMEHEAILLQRSADYDGYSDGMRASCAKRAAIKRACIEVIRRHAELMNDRQPESNQ